MAWERSKSIAARFSGQKETVTIPVPYITMAGSLAGGALLNQIVFHSATKEDGWFYKSYADWQREIHVSAHLVRTAVALFVERGWVETELRRAGTAAPEKVLHYRIVEDWDDRIKAFFAERLSKIEQTSVRPSNNEQTSINILTDDHENIDGPYNTYTTTYTTTEITREEPNAHAQGQVHAHMDEHAWLRTRMDVDDGVIDAEYSVLPARPDDDENTDRFALTVQTEKQITPLTSASTSASMRHAGHFTLVDLSTPSPLGTLPPGGAKVTNEGYLWALDFGWVGLPKDLQSIVDDCLDYHRKKGDRMQDWPAAIRTWIRHDHEYGYDTKRMMMRDMNALGSKTNGPHSAPTSKAGRYGYDKQGNPTNRASQFQATVEGLARKQQQRRMDREAGADTAPFSDDGWGSD